MNAVAASELVVLLRLSLFLGAAALAVEVVLKVARLNSSRIHRAAWFLVLLQGWFWWRLPVTVPCYAPAVVKEVSSAPTAPRESRTDRATRTFNGKMMDVEGPPRPVLVDTGVHNALPRPALPPIQIARDNHAAAHRPARSPGEDAAIGTPRPVDRQTTHSWTATVGRSWPLAILGGWAAGMLILAGASAVSYLRFLRGLHARQPAEETWVREWRDLLARHHVRRGAPLWVTAHVGPLLCLTPRGYRLVVPAGLWQRLAAEGRLSILRHELAHLRRHDLWKSIAVRLLVLPHWFNPLAWLAVRRFDEAAEWACDEAAKGADSQGCRAYAAALLQLDAACGPRPSYHAAASGRGLSVRVQRLLSPQVKEDSLMKKTTILAVALGLALLCLVRVDLVAKEPAAKDRAEKSLPKQAAGTAAAPSARTADGKRLDKPKTAPAAADALRYMPNGCQGVFWADVAGPRKINPSWMKTIGSGFGLKDEDIDRITVASPIWLTSESGFQFLRDARQTVATIAVAPNVTGREARQQIEKSFGPSAWQEETIQGVTLHVQQSKNPIAFFLPAKQTVVIGPPKLVREVLVRGTAVQLSGKLAAAWARLDQSHALGLMVAPPPDGDPARLYFPDDLCNECEAMLVEADLVTGKEACFRCRVPCAGTGVAYEVRGLLATFAKIAATWNSQWADAAKSFHFAMNDGCLVLQGRLPVTAFQDDSKSSASTARYYKFNMPRSFLPDELCDGIKSVQAEAEMRAGKDLHFRLSVPCVDAGIAHEVRGLFETCYKVMSSAGNYHLPPLNEAQKYMQLTVAERCFVLQGQLPTSTLWGDYTKMCRGYLPEDVCDGIKGLQVKAGMIPGKDLEFHFSVPCADDGCAYQIRGLFVTLFKASLAPQAASFPPLAAAIKSFQFVVHDRSFVWQGKLPTGIFQDVFKAAQTSYLQGSRPSPTTPQQQALCELSQTYLKGFQYGLTDPAHQEEAGRQLLAKARQRDREFPQDAKLNEAQRMFRDLSEIGDQGFLQAAQWQELDPQQKADEQRWLRRLKSENESARMLAIYALTAMGSKKAVPGILQIAADRKEKDNADREAACRALGILADLSVVPDLVHLTYHYNRDTRFWAQISLVRLTGENFGRDVDAWRRWWEKRGGKPLIAKEKIAWATSPECLQWADPKDMEKADHQILDMARNLSSGDGPKPTRPGAADHSSVPAPARPSVGYGSHSGTSTPPTTTPYASPAPKVKTPTASMSRPAGDARQVVVHLRAIKLDRTRMRATGIEIQERGVLDGMIAAVTGGEPRQARIQVLDRDHKLFDTLRALQKDGLATVVTEPSLVALNGRPSSFFMGGQYESRLPEFPQGQSPAFRKFGTEVTFLPKVMAGKRVRLEIRVSVSELEPPDGMPFWDVGPDYYLASRTNELETGAELGSGQTLVIHFCKSSESSRAEGPSAAATGSKALPAPAHATDHETEVLVLATPEIVEPVASSASAAAVTGSAGDRPVRQARKP
jgi:beta-lactamase regulating signal transducer with metallopeptidase domain